ncbi:MAG: tetratricopeptide repeat protein [Planctomyces sp.]|nr:tetratricopeptide repeat protein [Planctomyces sp.]
MAPEQFDGLADPRSDLYSLGLTLYELLALRPAFDEADRQKLIRQVTGATPPRLRSLDPQIPRDLETIVHKVIDRDPAHRYQSAEELAADLSRYLGDEPIRARRISPLARFRRWCRKNPLVAGLTSTIAVLVTAAAVAASIAAVRFEKLAEDNGKLAGDLKTALGDAERNLTLVREQERISQQNLTLANSEKQRAEGNLDLALQAMDAVYLEAIGEQKLLSAGRRGISPQQSDAGMTFDGFTPLERTLLGRGLKFYSQFAANNQSTSNFAAASSAQAFYRVAVLQGAIEDREAASTNFNEAIRRFKLLSENEPKNHHHAFNLSRALYGLAILQQDWTKATEIFKEANVAVTSAIVMSDTSVDYYNHRSQVLRSLGLMLPALADNEKAVVLAPDNIRVLQDAASSYINAAQYSNHTRAIQLCEMALEIDSENADVHNLFGTILYYEDQDRALHHYAEALRLRPNFAAVHAARARVYHSRGDFEKAIADASEAIRLSPTNAGYYVRRCEALMQLDRLEAARSDIEKAIELQPPSSMNFVRVLQAQANLFSRLGELENAEASFTRAIRQAPLIHWLHGERFLLRLRMKKYDAALADFRALKQLHPGPGYLTENDLKVLPLTFQQGVLDVLTELVESPQSEGPAKFAHGLMRFRFQVALGRASEAKSQAMALLNLENAQFATETIDHNPAARNTRTQFAFAVGRMDLAREDIEKLAKAENATYRQFYELALLSLADGRNIGNYKSACQRMMAKFAESRELDAVSSTGWTCALAPEALDDYGPAIDSMRKGLGKDPENPALLRSLGALQFRAGLFQQSIEALTPLASPGETAVEAKSSKAYALFFLAMAQHHAGQTEQGKQTLTRAVTLARQELSSHETLPWNRKLTLELLRDEAVAIIGPVDVP